MNYREDFEFWWTSHFDNIKLIGITYLIAKSKEVRCLYTKNFIVCLLVVHLRSNWMVF